VTKTERQHMDNVQSLGCIVCRRLGVYSPAEIHHVLDGNRRRGHMYVLPLCVPHHRGGSDGVSDQFYSRHPYKKRFEHEYGSEAELLETVQELLHE